MKGVTMIIILEVLLLLFILFVLLYLYLTWNHKYWETLGIASDEPSWLLGSFAGSTLMRRHRGEEIDLLYEKFPGEKVVGWYNFRKPALLVRDPDLVHKVLVTDFYHFRNNDVDADEARDPLTSRNIFMLKDDEWKRGRALVTPAFTSGKIKAVYPQMAEVAKEFAEYLGQHPEQSHVKDAMSRYTTEVIAKCALGIEADAFKEDKPKIHEVGKAMFNPSFGQYITVMIVMFFPTLNKLLRLRFIPKMVATFFDSILRDIIVYRQENSVQRNDLINYLIELKNRTIEVEKGNVKSDVITRAYTDEDILAGCVMFFIEAYETSALHLNNILYQLALHKEVQDKLRREIDEQMKKGEVTYEALHEMKYLNCVTQETNRIMPVTNYLFKRCTENYDMDAGKARPIRVQKGMSILIPLHGLQMDDKYWDEPRAFKPERFDGSDDGKFKSVFMPFGEGPRKCIGVRISTTMIKLALVHILSRLEVSPTSKTPKKINLDTKYFMITHKGGIPLRFDERSK